MKNNNSESCYKRWKHLHVIISYWSMFTRELKLLKKMSMMKLETFSDQCRLKWKRNNINCRLVLPRSKSDSYIYWVCNLIGKGRFEKCLLRMHYITYCFQRNYTQINDISHNMFWIPFFLIQNKYQIHKTWFAVMIHPFHPFVRSLIT